MSQRPEVIVVGAGVVGATAADRLSAAGARVVLLDAAEDIGGGCSYANAGVLAPDHVGPLATRSLVVEGARQLLARPPAVRVRPQPSLVPFLSRLVASALPSRAAAATALLGDLAHRSAQRHRQYAADGFNPSYRHTGALEVRFRRGAAGDLPVTRARELVPALGAATAAHHDPDEAVVDSRTYLRHLLRSAADRGADVRFSVPVTEVLLERGRVRGVRTAAGELTADRVVLATGLATTALARSAGLHVPLRGGRGYVVDLQPGDLAPRMPVRLLERRIVITPLPDRLRICGLMQFGAERLPLDRRRSDAMVEVAAKALPGAGIDTAAVLDTWCGERPCAADGVPVIGASRRVPGLTIAAGHGMWGLILAPVTAELVTAAVTDDADAHPLLHPDRFARSEREAVVTPR